MTIQELSIPAVNLGVFGKGAHTWKERIHKPYSYEVLPQLIRKSFRIYHARRTMRKVVSDYPEVLAIPDLTEETDAIIVIS